MLHIIPACNFNSHRCQILNVLSLKEFTFDDDSAHAFAKKAKERVVLELENSKETAASKSLFQYLKEGLYQEPREGQVSKLF